VDRRAAADPTRPVVLSAAASLAPALAADRSVSDAVWADLLATAMTEGGIAADEAGRLLVAHPFRLTAVSRRLTQPQLQSVLDAVPWPHAYTLLFAAGFAVRDAEEYLQLVRRLLARTTERDVLDVLAAARTQLGRRTLPASWAPTIVPVLVGHVQAVLADPMAPYRFELMAEATAGSRGTEVQPWAELVHDLSATRFRSLFPAALHRLAPELAVHAARFALDRRVGQLRTDRELPPLVAAYYGPAGLDPAGLARALLTAALRAVGGPSGGARAGRVLQYVAEELVDGGHLPRSRWASRVADKDVQYLAASLATAVGHAPDVVRDHLDALAAARTTGGDWLYTLLRHA
jgi:hypothetical protein